MDIKFIKGTECDSGTLAVFRAQIDDIMACNQKPSLDLRVRDAFTLREQGHFSVAMRTIAEVSRDQVLAIRRIQNLFSRLANVPNQHVVFSKFRQQLPLEIGVENAGDTLTLIMQLDLLSDGLLPRLRDEFHSLEADLKVEEERLGFFQARFPDEVNEIAGMTELISTLAARQIEINETLLTNIFDLVGALVASRYGFQGNENQFLEISANLFFVYMSPIKTKAALSVEV